MRIRQKYNFEGTDRYMKISNATGCGKQAH